MKKIRVLLIDDHKMIRDGLRVMLETHKEKYTFAISEAESGEEGIEKVKKNEYDVILLDYQLPGINGAYAARVIMQIAPDSKILALSNYSEYAYVDKMLNTGRAKGYVLKNIGPDELIRAIETVMTNKKYYSNEVAQSLLSHDRVSGRGQRKKKIEPGTLSQREMEVLKLIAEENTNEQIAHKLYISKRTVEAHRQNIMIKLQVSNKMGLIKAALQLFSLSI